jgi:Calx-beta domain
MAVCQAVTVQYQTADGTAAAGSDYVARGGTLTFGPGETSKTVSVTVNGDSAVEGDETFFLDLSSPVNATILDGRGVGTIIDDDLPGTL